MDTNISWRFKFQKRETDSKKAHTDLAMSVSMSMAQHISRDIIGSSFCRRYGAVVCHTHTHIPKHIPLLLLLLLLSFVVYRQESLKCFTAVIQNTIKCAFMCIFFYFLEIDDLFSPLLTYFPIKKRERERQKNTSEQCDINENSNKKRFVHIKLYGFKSIRYEKNTNRQTANLQWRFFSILSFLIRLILLFILVISYSS